MCISIHAWQNWVQDDDHSRNKVAKWAARTKYHRSGSLQTTEVSFLQFWSWKSEIKVIVFVRALLTVSSHGGKGCLLSSYCFIWYIIHFCYLLPVIPLDFSANPHHLTHYTPSQSWKPVIGLMKFSDSPFPIQPNDLSTPPCSSFSSHRHFLSYKCCPTSQRTSPSLSLSTDYFFKRIERNNKAQNKEIHLIFQSFQIWLSKNFAGLYRLPLIQLSKYSSCYF